MKWLELVRDGAVIQRRGADWPGTRYTFRDDQVRLEARRECVAGPVCYYLRVLFGDGNMAWSSPIWVRCG